MLYSLPGADGLKTGHTDEAGFCLTGSVKRGDRRLIEVIAGLKSNKERSIESEELMTWGFANFENYKFFNQNQIMATVPVWYGALPTVDLVVPEKIVKTIKKSKKNKYSAKIFYNTPVKAPIAKGEQLGEIHIMYNGEIKEKVPLVAKEDVAKVNFISRFVANLKYFIFGTGK